MVISKLITLPFQIKRADTAWLRFTGFLRTKGHLSIQALC